MQYDRYIHHRQSIRLKEYDYSEAGAYFVTVCTTSRECMFGDVETGEMRLNDAGRIVHNVWNALPDRFPNVEMDEFIIMPNHIHGIIVIVGAPLVGALIYDRAGTRPAPTLGDIVGTFKSITTHQYVEGIRQKNWTPFNGRLWQRNYYEHIIRNEWEMDRIRGYIIGNPVKWADDEDNPENFR